MRRVLFVHSAGTQGPVEGSGRFLARLRAELGAGYEIAAPMMPDPDNPEPGPWLDALSGPLAETPEPFALVGHSLGGSIILKHLAERGVPDGLAGVVTIAAPFWGPRGWDYDGFALPADAAAKLKGLGSIILLFGRQDDTVATDHLDLYRAALPSAEGRLIDGDHEFATGDIHAVRDAISSLPGFGTTVRE